jgi:hypothetical protein
MPDEFPTYRLVKIHLVSGCQKSLLLSQQEILNLSMALNRQNKELQCFTFWYDGPDKKLSGVLVLDKVQFMEVDDKDLSFRDMELINYKKFRIWEEPSWFRKSILKIKWFFEDRKKKVK